MGHIQQVIVTLELFTIGNSWICLPGMLFFFKSYNHFLVGVEELIQSVRTVLESFEKLFGKHMAMEYFLSKVADLPQPKIF